MTNQPSRPQVLATVAVLALAISPVAVADTVDLPRNTQVDGEVLGKKELGEKSFVIVKVDSELMVAIPEVRVTRVTKDSDEVLSKYREATEMAGNDAELHYQLARWCTKHGLREQRNFHYRRVLDIDPEHSRARAALDYKRDGNEWVLEKDLQESRGLISIKNNLMVPEVYQQTKAADDAKDAAAIWKTNFKKMRRIIRSGGKRFEETLAEIQAIDDPHAAEAFADALKASRTGKAENQKMRLLYVRKLGEFRNRDSVKALVAAGLYERDGLIRSEALTQLQNYGAPSAVASYLSIVRSEKSPPALVTAALRGLMYFPDPELWRDYVDALKTVHETVTPAGPGTQVGQNSLGGFGLNMGSKPKVQQNVVQNPDALALLKAIAPDVDLRYDEAAWRQYFADRLMGQPTDLRRDP